MLKLDDFDNLSLSKKKCFCPAVYLMLMVCAFIYNIIPILYFKIMKCYIVIKKFIKVYQTALYHCKNVMMFSTCVDFLI